MAESGILSAVGLCIESVWRKVPHTGTAVGVSTTNPHRFFTVEPGGGFVARPDIMVPADEIDGEIELKRTILGAKDYEGGFSFKADAENLLYPLLGVFGKDIQTQISGTTTTTITAAYSHLFTPNLYAPSFTVEEKYGRGNSGRLSSGVIFNQLDLAFGRVVTASLRGVAYRQIPNTYPNASGVDTDYDFTSSSGALPGQMNDGVYTDNIAITSSPTYIDVYPSNLGNGPFSFGGMSYGSESGFSSSYCKIDDVAVDVKILEGFNLSIARGLESHHIAGAGYDPGDCTGNGIAVTGNIGILYSNNSINSAVLKKSKFSFNFKITGISIGNSGQKYTIEVYIPRARFIESSTDLVAGAMTAGGNFVAEKDTSLGYGVKITLINTTSVSSLGGKVSSSPGGMGGWSNS
mgnify:CR=1 FL=1